MNKKELKDLNKTLQKIIGFMFDVNELEKKKGKALEELIEETINTNNVHCLFIEDRLGLSAAAAADAFYEWIDEMDGDEIQKRLEDRNKQFNDNEEDQSTDEEDDPGPLHTMDDILNLFKE